MKTEAEERPLTRSDEVNAWTAHQETFRRVQAIPLSWFHELKDEKGGTDIVACLVLSEIAYWHEACKGDPGHREDFRFPKRPKFTGEHYRLNRGELKWKFGLARSTVTRALNRLANKFGVIWVRNPRPDKIELGLCVERLAAITYDTLDYSDRFSAPCSVEHPPVAQSTDRLSATLQATVAQSTHPVAQRTNPVAQEQPSETTAETSPVDSKRGDSKNRDSHITRRVGLEQTNVADAPSVSQGRRQRDATLPSASKGQGKDEDEDKPRWATELNPERIDPEPDGSHVVQQESEKEMRVYPRMERRAGAPVPPPFKGVPSETINPAGPATFPETKPASAYNEQEAADVFWKAKTREQRHEAILACLRLKEGIGRPTPELQAKAEANLARYIRLSGEISQEEKILACAVVREHDFEMNKLWSAGMHKQDTLSWIEARQIERRNLAEGRSHD